MSAFTVAPPPASAIRRTQDLDLPRRRAEASLGARPHRELHGAARVERRPVEPLAHRRGLREQAIDEVVGGEPEEWVVEPHRAREQSECVPVRLRFTDGREGGLCPLHHVLSIGAIEVGVLERRRGGQDHVGEARGVGQEPLVHDRLEGDSIMAFPDGCAYRRRLNRWLGDARPAGLRFLDLGSYHAIVACVASGAGIALVPESVLDAVQGAQVRRHPIAAAQARVVTPLIWRAGEESTALVALKAELKRGVDERSAVLSRTGIAQ